MDTRRAALILTLLSGHGLVQAAGYKVKPIDPKPAVEYAARQNFQNIIIGAQPYTTQEEIQTIFDAKKMFERKIMPVLIVIQNNNAFALRIYGSDIFLVGPDGVNIPPIDPVEVMLTITLKKPLSSYSTRKEILLRQAVDPKMALDFERKVFSEKLIPPSGSDFGILFFPLPDGADLSGFRLYFPTIENLTEGEELMFFEFDLSPSR